MRKEEIQLFICKWYDFLHRKSYGIYKSIEIDNLSLVKSQGKRSVCKN